MSMSATDRISEFPEAILHHILSYLPIRDAARASVLSKWWNNAWETLPYLNFNDESFMIHNTDYLWQIEKNRDLLAVVQRIVQNRQQQNISIEKFSLLVLPWKYEHDQYEWFQHPPSEEEEPPSEEERRRRWHESWRERYREIGFSSFNVINYVATPFLRELKLINYILKYKSLLLPPSILSANWLTALTLNRFDLCSSWSLLDIKFICLQKLVLKYVVLDDDILKNLTLGSRLTLETLKLKMCRGLKTIHLDEKFIKLKRLTVVLEMATTSIEVYDVPEFQELHFSKTGYFNVKNCPLLRKVFLHLDFFTENNLHQLLASSKHLEELSIRSSSLLKNINIVSDSLKTLTLYSLYNLRNLHIFSPTLKCFTYKVRGYKQDYLPNFFLNDSNPMLRVYLRLKCDLECVKFLSYFKHIKTVTLEIEHILIIPKYIEKMLSPLYGTRDISFRQVNRKLLMKNAVMKLVEYLLWLAPRAERVSIGWLHTTTSLSLELVYHPNEEEKRNFNCCYCKSLPTDCWRHCLKEVRIQIFEESKHDIFEDSEHDLVMMKDFFLKEVKNLPIVNSISYNKLHGFVEKVKKFVSKNMFTRFLLFVLWKIGARV